MCSALCRGTGKTAGIQGSLGQEQRHTTRAAWQTGLPVRYVCVCTLPLFNLNWLQRPFPHVHSLISCRFYKPIQRTKKKLYTSKKGEANISTEHAAQLTLNEAVHTFSTQCLMACDVKLSVQVQLNVTMPICWLCLDLWPRGFILSSFCFPRASARMVWNLFQTQLISRD